MYLDKYSWDMTNYEIALLSKISNGLENGQRRERTRHDLDMDDGRKGQGMGSNDLT